MIALRTLGYRVSSDMVLAALILFVAAVGLSRIPWLARDWTDIYRLGALNLAAPNDAPGGNYAAPWTYVLLWPFAVLPDWLSAGALTLATLFIVRRYVGGGGKFLWVCATMPLVATVAFGQVDAISLLALTVPASLSLVLLACKPQGAALAALRRLSWWSVSVLLATFVLSLAVWGRWFADVLSPVSFGSNVSPFPYGVPVAAWILWRQWKRGFPSDGMLCLATLLLSPFFFYGSMLPAVAALVKESDSDARNLLCVGASWIYAFIMGAGMWPCLR